MSNLNPKLFSLQAELESMREAFGDELYRLGGEYAKIVALTADLRESTGLNQFAEAYPERFFEVGVAEQNLAAVASGLAAMGKIPFMTSFSIFSPGRNWEQIRTTICYNNQPVKIVSTHSGLSAAADGGSHQALEDLVLTRVLPNLTVIAPCDANETRRAVQAISKNNSPVYLRLSREKLPNVTSKTADFKIGKAEVLRSAERPVAAIIACGPLVYEALLAAKKLAEEKIQVTVINCHTIKPLDQKTIIAAAKTAGAVVTAEEHQVAGGLGGAVAEVLAQNYPVPIEFVGVHNRFGQSGHYHQLLETYGLTAHSIIEAVKTVIERKK